MKICLSGILCNLHMILLSAGEYFNIVTASYNYCNVQLLCKASEGHGFRSKVMQGQRGHVR